MSELTRRDLLKAFGAAGGAGIAGCYAKEPNSAPAMPAFGGDGHTILQTALGDWQAVISTDIQSAEIDTMPAIVLSTTTGEFALYGVSPGDQTAHGKLTIKVTDTISNVAIDTRPTLVFALDSAEAAVFGESGVTASVEDVDLVALIVSSLADASVSEYPSLVGSLSSNELAIYTG